MKQGKENYAEKLKRNVLLHLSYKDNNFGYIENSLFLWAFVIAFTSYIFIVQLGFWFSLSLFVHCVR